MGWASLEPVHIMISVKQVKSQVQQNSLTESDLLGLGDDVDAGVGACALGEAVTCNSKGSEHTHNR